VERKSHIMPLVADEGLALFAGLNAIPKKSYLSEYASRISHEQTTRLLAAFQHQLAAEALLPGRSFNLDFQCAVQRHGFPVGANPTRQLSLRPVAIGAAV
jgi:hypothetical protein